MLVLVSTSQQMSSASPPHSGGFALSSPPLPCPGLGELSAAVQGCRALGQDSGGINIIQPKVPVPEQHLGGAISSHQLPPEQKTNVSLRGARAPDLQEPVAGLHACVGKET